MALLPLDRIKPGKLTIPLIDMFDTIHNVPPELQKHQGARLSLDQINQVVAKAYELNADDPDMGAAWVEFRATHEIVGDIWVTRSLEEPIAVANTEEAQ